jgi:hypothetical protein
MRSRDLNCFALNVCVAAAMLAGCGGSQVAPTGGPMISSHATRGKSWMLPEAKSQDLLYVARSSPGEVSVYTYPKGKPVGTISIAAPNGICSDGKGNVFVVGVESQQIYEYAHGGSQPIATLDDSGNNPLGCAVDPSSGDLAVTGGDGLANAAIYQNAQGSPTVYTDPFAGAFTFCTYDSQSNLFMGGGDLFELPKGGNSFVEIPIMGGPSETSPPGIQWDGNYIALQQTGPSRKGPARIYQISISGSSASAVNEIDLSSRLNENPHYGAQFWIGNGTIVSPESTNRNIGLWHYPKGGKEYHTIKVSAKEGFLTAVTVSFASKH